MIEIYGDLWKYPCDYKIITTNGTVRRDNAAVMGRGCAREASLRFQTLQQELGEALRLHGNHVRVWEKYKLLTFPVKHEWQEQASITLIQRSVRELIDIACTGEHTYALPRPGCGNGGLRYETVRPFLLDLPDNVAIIAFKGQETK